MWEARYLCYINNTTLVLIGHRVNSNKYHYVRESLEDGLIDLSYILTVDMMADCLTKPLKREKFHTGLSLIGLIDA